MGTVSTVFFLHLMTWEALCFDVRFSWADFLQKALPEALERAAGADVRFREGLPLQAFSSLGEQYLGFSDLFG